MDVEITRIDLERTRASWPDGDFSPAHVHARRNDKQLWYVLDAPYTPGSPPVLSSTGADSYIRIPIFPYSLSCVGDIALAHMFQLGMSFANNISGKIAKIHIVTGQPVELVYLDKNLDHMTYWFGFAYLLSE